MVQYRPPTSTIGKFASRALWGIYPGISHEYKAWLILDLTSQKIRNARDVIFYERLFLEQFREDKWTNANRVYANYGHNNTTLEDEAAATILEQDTRAEFTGGDRCSSDDDDENSLGGGVGGAGGSSRGAAPPPPLVPENDDDDVQEVIPQYRHDSTISCIIEPKKLRQALMGPHNKEWRKAMDAEFKALESHDTWVLVDRAAIKRRRILYGKWVFRMKTAVDGTINRHTFVGILLAIAAARHLQLRQIDVKNMFLYTLVDAVIYVEQSLTYGKGDSRFKQLPHNPGMYHRNFRGDYILLTVVDDLLYTGSSRDLLEQFERNLAGRIDITCNHDVKQFLGLNISYSPESIHLSGAKHEELGKRFNIAPAPLSTPYRTPGPNHKPDNKALSLAGLQAYQQQLGCLLFTSVTCRPNLSYIASQLAQHSHKPTAENLMDLQRALQFFISTPNIRLCYSTVPTSFFNLISYVDADRAADLDNRWSRTGFLFRPEPTGPISRNSQKQELVALSSAEAELIAVTATVHEALYLHERLQEAKIPSSPTFCLHCDNQSVIRITNKPGFVNPTKHIALWYFFVKDKVDKGKDDLTYCSTGDMAADFLTK
ncbi:unnamed protein product [Closterium sp. NIES-53]